MKKCEFLKLRLDFLGHEVTGEGTRPCERLVKKVLACRTPVDSTEVRQYLGLAGYYRKHVERYAQRTRPMSMLLSKEQPWVWGEEQQKAFEESKQRLAERPLLRHPDFARPLTIHTDASHDAIGGVLVQKDDQEKEHPVAYFSRVLQAAELRYPASEKE